MDLKDLEIFGNRLVIIADIISAKASEEESGNNSQGKNTISENEINRLNVIGSILTFIADLILAIVVVEEAKEEGDPYSQATIDGINGSWIIVIGDFLIAKSSIEDANGTDK